MKIITLIENHVNSPGLVAEHGLSLYIDTGNKKILFDTGQSGLFIQNAQKLGIDIREIDLLVISHGHYDHTGGLYQFLEVNKKATVYAKKEIFTPKYSGKTRFIGTQPNEELLADLSYQPLKYTIKLIPISPIFIRKKAYHSIPIYLMMNCLSLFERTIILTF